MDIKIINTTNFENPQYATKNSAGMDLKSNIETYLEPNERTIIPTGLFIELPKGFEAQVRPRSGLAIKHGITIVNTPGTIDSDYRGEIGIILINHGNKRFNISKGDRIAQLVINKYKKIEWINVKNLTNTKRNEGGFGSTGK